MVPARAELSVSGGLADWWVFPMSGTKHYLLGKQRRMFRVPWTGITNRRYLHACVSGALTTRIHVKIREKLMESDADRRICQETRRLQKLNRFGKETLRSATFWYKVIASRFGQTRAVSESQGLPR